ncbi:MAG: hypothetical protein ACE5EF_05510 [Dehalococcoidia bacterium]
MRDTLREARELPWDADSQAGWQRRFNELITRALSSVRQASERMEDGRSAPRLGSGVVVAELLREQADLSASLEALAADAVCGRDLSVAEYVALHERTVILESDVVRLAARLGGTPAHDPRTLVGAACRLPGVRLGL